MAKCNLVRRIDTDVDCLAATARGRAGREGDLALVALHGESRRQWQVKLLKGR